MSLDWRSMLEDLSGPGALSVRPCPATGSLPHGLATDFVAGASRRNSEVVEVAARKGVKLVEVVTKSRFLVSMRAAYPALGADHYG